MRARTRKAIVLDTPGNAVIMEVPVPPVRPVYALVKTTAVALNAVDSYSIDYYGSNGTISGCDFAGEVVEVGSQVEQDLKPGDRVAGFVHGNKTDSMDVVTELFQEAVSGKRSANALSQEIGAFADVTLAHGDIMMKIPAQMSDEEAATFGSIVTVAGMALYKGLKLPTPDAPSKQAIPLLIGGGATGSGAMAIQLAKLSGLRVITTCSPANFEYVKSLGADFVYDYNDPDCARKIRRDNPMIEVAYETGNENEGWEVVEKSFSLCGGRAVVNKYPSRGCSRKDVSMTHFSSFASFGQRFTLGPYDLPDSPEDYAWAKAWWRTVSRLVAEGKLKPHRPLVREGGLQGVLDGIQDIRDLKIRGHKLVYRM